MPIPEIIKELTSWKSEFSEAMSFFRIEPNQKILKEISNRYSMLKQRIIERLKELESMSANNMLDEEARTSLLPAIREVALHCNARIGSMNKEELSSSLYDAEDYLAYHLSELTKL